MRLKFFNKIRHIFGAKFSPTCNNFALQKLASDNKDEFPQATQAVFDSFYVDDFLKSFTSVDEAIGE